MKILLDRLGQYLALRRSLGFKLRDHERALRNFVVHLQAQGAEFITTEMALEWAQQPRNVTQAHRARRLGMVRDFARHLAASDPRTEIPPQGLLPGRTQRTQPYIYSEKQILSLIREAEKLLPVEGLRPHIYSTLFGLLAVTGMRVGEVVALGRGDVDLSQGVLTLRQTKFNNTRLLPIHPSTQRRLQSYARRRDELVPVQSTDSLFISDHGTRLKHFTVRWIFVKISRQIGLRSVTDSHGPRLHDLRHTFAVRTLINWYQSGTDPEKQLPLLSAYLGHAKLSDTYWYLSAVPELLGAVNTRLEHVMGDLS